MKKYVKITEKYYVCIEVSKDWVQYNVAVKENEKLSEPVDSEWCFHSTFQSCLEEINKLVVFDALPEECDYMTYIEKGGK